jgi:hypothetical protein
MKKIDIYVKFVLIAVLLLSISLNSKSQGIDSLQIIPDNPSTEDNVKAISFITAPGQSVIDTTTLSIEDSLVLLSIYGTEMFPYVDGTTQLNDTLNLGELQSGKYYLVGHLYGRQQEEDSTYTIYGLGSISDTLPFLISSLGNVDFINNDNEIFIYPNPARKTLNIFLNDNEISRKYNLEIHSLNGMMIASKVIYETTILDLTNYSPGIYLLTIKHNNKSIQKEKLIVE